MRTLIFLLSLCALFVSLPARSDDEGVFSHCNRFAGGTFTAERPDRWREHGYRINLKGARVNASTEGTAFAVASIRQQIDRSDQIEDPISWSAWVFTQDFDEVEGVLMTQTKDILWILRAEGRRLVGRQLRFPVTQDRETNELKSLVEDGELGITLECVRWK